MNETAIPARIVDMSEGGMRLRLNRRIASDTHVGLAIDGRLITGQIRYCLLHRSTGDFVVGLQLDHKLEDVEDIVKRHGGRAHDEVFAL